MNLLEQYMDVNQIRAPQTIDEELRHYFNSQVGQLMDRNFFVAMEQDIINICLKYFPDGSANTKIIINKDTGGIEEVTININREMVWKWQNTI